MSDLFVEGIIEENEDAKEEKEEEQKEKSFCNYDEAERIERIFADLSLEEKAELKKQYIKELIAKSHERIRKISGDIIEHFTKHIQPNGFKAMLVAISREAAVRY